MACVACFMLLFFCYPPLAERGPSSKQTWVFTCQVVLPKLNTIKAFCSDQCCYHHIKTPAHLPFLCDKHQCCVVEALSNTPVMTRCMCAYIKSASSLWKARCRKRKRHTTWLRRPVYLLFSSALTARDWLGLLNWALSTHIAALKLPDGWEGINSSRRLQELLQSNGTITQVDHVCIRG